MPIQVECPSCGKRYRMKDELAGSSVSCRECGEDIDVPDEWGNAAPARRSAPAKRRSAKKAKNSMLPVYGAAAVGGLIVGVIVVVMGLRGGNKDAANQPNQPGNPVVADNPPPIMPPPTGVPSQRQASNPSGGGFNQASGTGALPPAANSGFSNAGSQKSPFELLKETVAVPPIQWSVRPDPPAEPVTFAEKKLRLRIPDSGGSGDGVVFPVVPSPYVALGKNGTAKDTREIWNLSTGNKAHTIKGVAFHETHPTLSPDGRYWAFTEFSQGKMNVYDIKEKKPLGVIKVEDAKFLSGSAFVRSNRLLAWNNKTVWLWEIPSGKLERTIDLPDRSTAETLCFSPGGRYLGVARRDRSEQIVALYDLDAGEMAGELPLPSYKGVSGNLNLKALAFSPDGTELAGACEIHSLSKLLVWGLKDGSLTGDLTFDKSLDKLVEPIGYHQRDKDFAWFPDGRRWLLFGHGIIDRDAGDLLFLMPPSAVHYPNSRKPLDHSHVAVVDGERGQQTLTSYELPEDKLRRAAEVVKSGGLPIDATLPPLTTADWSKVADMTAADVGGWQVRPDPAPQPPEKLLARAMPLKSDKGNVRQVVVSRADSAKMFVRCTDDDPIQGRMDPEGKKAKATWIDVYDLVARKPTKKIDVGFPCEMLAASPDGTRILVRGFEAATKGRLDVFSAETGEHVVGWRPFQDDPNEDQREVTAAAFIDATHVATVNPLQKLAVWELPSCRAVYSVDHRSQPALSPGGKYLALFDESNYEFRDALTGAARGSVRISGKVQGMSFHPNGQRLALAVSDRGGSYLLEVDLASGQIREEVPLPVSATRMHWCGEQFVLLDNARLLSLPHKAVAWSYSLPVGVHLPGSGDGRHWYVAVKSQRVPAPQLVAADMPGSDVAQRIANANLKPDYIVQPGSKVSLQLQLAATPDRPNLAQEVRDKLTKTLQEQGIIVEDGQPITLRLTSTQTATGEKIPYQRIGQGQTEEVAEQKVTCKAAYVRGNETLWESQEDISNRTFFTMVRGNETAEQAVNRGMWGQAATFFENLVPPPYVFPKRSAEGLGSSILTVDGPTNSGPPSRG